MRFVITRHASVLSMARGQRLCAALDQQPALKIWFVCVVVNNFTTFCVLARKQPSSFSWLSLGSICPWHGDIEG